MIILADIYAASLLIGRPNEKKTYRILSHFDFYNCTAPLAYAAGGLDILVRFQLYYFY